jgi:hypothetical protein
MHKNGKCLYFTNKKYFVEVIQCSGEEMNLVLMGVYPSSLNGINNTNNSLFNLNFSPKPPPPPPQNQPQPTFNILNNSYMFSQNMMLPPPPSSSSLPPLVGSMGMQMPLPLPSANNICFSPPQTTNNIPYTSSLAQGNFNLPHLRQYTPATTALNPTTTNIQTPSSLLQNHTHQTTYPPLIYWFPTTPPISPSSNQSQSTSSQAVQTQTGVPWVLILKGAPLNVKKADVLQFFSGFDVMTDYVQIHAYNESFGVADAFVTFSSRCEAERALISKNYHKLGNNLVELFLAV